VKSTETGHFAQTIFESFSVPIFPETSEIEKLLNALRKSDCVERSVQLLAQESKKKIEEANQERDKVLLKET
jgi:hypothetical protein